MCILVVFMSWLLKTTPIFEITALEIESDMGLPGLKLRGRQGLFILHSRGGTVSWSFPAFRGVHILGSVFLCFDESLLASGSGYSHRACAGCSPSGTTDSSQA